MAKILHILRNEYASEYATEYAMSNRGQWSTSKRELG